MDQIVSQVQFMQVRPVQSTDIVALLPLCAIMHSESRYADMPYDEAVVRQLLEHSINSTQLRTMVLEDEDGRVVGGGIVRVERYIFNRRFIAYDLGLYVAPACRSYKAASLLIHAMEQWALSNGASRFVTSITAPPDMRTVRELTKLYVSLGYELTGTTLSKDLMP